jgi:hypothetical protein
MNQTEKKRKECSSLSIARTRYVSFTKFSFPFETKSGENRRIFKRLLAVSSTECTKGHPQGLAHYPASTALLILAPLVSRLSPSQTPRLGSKLDVKMEKNQKQSTLKP